MGILVGLYLKIGIALFVISLLSIFSIWHIHSLKKSKYTLYILVLNAILLLSIFYTKTISKQYETVYQTLENKEIVIEGMVVSAKQEKEYSSSYQIKIQTINGKRIYQGKKFILKIKNKEITLKQGNLIRVKGKYEKPQSSRNTKGFNYQEYLKSQNLYGTITAKETIEILQKDKSSIFSKVIVNIQNKIKENMKELLPKETKDICIGILIGNKTELSGEIKEDFKNSNLTHMLAVSGAHISYVILTLSFLLNKTGKKFYKISTIFFLIFFMALTNFTPSVMRASIMSILELLSGIFYRKSDVYQNLALSSLIVLLINPYTIFNQGFQLSFAGTLGIVYLHKRLSDCIYTKIKIKKKFPKNMIDIILVTLSANLAILPIMAYQFNTISLTFWISNILASPFMGIIMILGFLTFFISLIFFPIAKILAFPLKFALMGLLKISQICAKIPLSSILVKTPYLISIILYYFLIILWKKKYFNWLLKNKKQFFIILLIVIILFQFCNLFISGNLYVYFIDVGQGDSCLIITPKHKAILIDGGGSETGSFDVGESTLVPYLLDRRIKTLDYVIISHFDTDHVGGILTVLEKLAVKTVIISKQGEDSSNYQRFKEILKEKKVKVEVVEKGDKVKIEEDVWVDILWPNSASFIKENILNNNSIVCKLQYQDFSMLFTGDIEEVAEKQILQKWKDSQKLNATILKVRSSWLKNLLNRRIFRSGKTKNSTHWSRRKEYFWSSK